MQPSFGLHFEREKLLKINSNNRVLLILMFAYFVEGHLKIIIAFSSNIHTPTLFGRLF